MNKDADDQEVDPEARANQIVKLTTDKIKAQSENESIRIDLNNLKKTHDYEKLSTDPRTKDFMKDSSFMKLYCDPRMQITLQGLFHFIFTLSEL